MSHGTNRKMVLCAFLHNMGAHPGGWRYPGSAAARSHDIALFREMAEAAERAKLHALFLGDAQGYLPIAGREAYAGTDNAGKLEPLTLLSALAIVTRHLGLIATASTTYNEPYALARRFASLDHISGGRAGWNIVTSTTESEARNFGRDAHMEHEARYERAEEFVDVARLLWDCWEDGAVLADQASGRFFDPAKVHALEFGGKHFKVAGPLNIVRPPQGNPILVQAGSSEPGRRLAARTADLVFTAQPDLKSGQRFYADMKARAATYGRDPAHVFVIPSLQVIVRGTVEESQKAARELIELVPAATAISTLEMLLGGVDLSRHPVDGPVPDLPPSHGGQGQWVREKILDIARAEGLTIATAARRATASRASWLLVGTPEQVADRLEEWFTAGAADGFSIAPNYFPSGLTEFTEAVVPILQRRGLFQTDYAHGTLRENLGLPRPANSFVAHPELSAEPQMWSRPARN